MAKSTHLSKKLKLVRKGRQTRWAPFWTVPKIFGPGRRIHPGRQTAVKRNWRRSKTKV